MTLPGVAFGRLTRYPDSRGSFAEAWRAVGSTGAGGGASAAPFPGVQANLSSSAAGVLRGLHVHRRQDDLWIVLSGRAFITLVDIRALLEDPSAKPRIETATLERDDTVTIPAGVAHGFLALAPLDLLYLVTNEYDGTDELGFAWDDPTVSVAWPPVPTLDGRPTLSERDQRNPPLATLIETLRAAT